MTQPPIYRPAELAQLVRGARLKLGLSKVAVAKAIRLSDQWLGDIEKGDNPNRRLKRPKFENVRALAHILRLNEAAVLNLAGYSADNAPIELGGRPSCSEVEFRANVNRMPAEVRALFMQLAAAVTNGGTDHTEKEAAA